MKGGCTPGLEYCFVLFYIVSRDGTVAMATGYGLDIPETESRWGRDIPHLTRPALGPNQPPIQWIPGLPGV
jgi:hypothetical protein